MIALFVLVLAVCAVHGVRVLTQPRDRLRRPSTLRAVLVTLPFVFVWVPSVGAAAFIYAEPPAAHVGVDEFVAVEASTHEVSGASEGSALPSAQARVSSTTPSLREVLPQKRFRG